MTKKRLSLTLIIIILLLGLIGLIAFYQRTKFPTTLKPEPEKPQSFQKYPALKELVEPEVAKAPDASWISVISNKEMDIAYVIQDDTYFVTIYDIEKEASVKEGIKKYFEALGVEDFSSLKIEYRIKPKV